MINTGYALLLAWVVVESFSARDVLAAYQLDGEVMAHHGFDG